MKCALCGESDPDRFTEAVKREGRKRCRECMKQKIRVYRGDFTKDRPLRLLSNLTTRCKTRGIPEGALWVLDDVHVLLDKYYEETKIDFEDERYKKIKMSIVRVDKTKPFLPNNAKIKLYGNYRI